MDSALLEKTILENGYSSFRLKQAKKNIFARLIGKWSEATDLPEDLRALLTRAVPLSTLEPVRLQESAQGDTAKTLLKTRDGFLIEAVLMRHDGNRRTVCVSSQAGCPMNCSFCATGKLGLQRSLTADEIVDQILFFARFLKQNNEQVTNVVYMGMGEPFHNYDPVMASVRTLNDPHGFHLGARHISISTCGIVPGINKFAEEKLQVNLAISLHAPDDATRSKIMPVNAPYPMAKLMDAVNDYVRKTRRKVMFEYILISGVNDSEEHAQKLAALMGKYKLYHVNLIKYHETFQKDGVTPVYRTPSRERMKRFFDILKKAGVSCTFRVSFGEDISGACGQLAAR